MSSSSSTSSNTISSSCTSSPCAACKLLRRRCCQDQCVFAPYFPANEPHKFASVHKVFGASNVSKMLQELGEDQRGDAVSAMVYEAYARLRDPVYGCAGAISSLQQQVDSLRSQLADAQAQVAHFSSIITTPQSQYSSSSNNNFDQHHHDHDHTTTSPTISSSFKPAAMPRYHPQHFQAMIAPDITPNNTTTTLHDNHNNNNNNNGDYSLWSY